MHDPYAWAAGAALTAVAAVWDFRTQRIPNALLAVGAGIVVCTRLIPMLPGAELGAVAGELGSALAAGVACLLAPLALWLAGALGGGDVKLLGVIGIAFGLRHGLMIQLWGYVAAAGFAVLRGLVQGQFTQVLADNLRVARGKKASQPSKLLIFGPPLFVAMSIYLLLHW